MSRSARSSQLPAREAEAVHVPVMLDEIISSLKPSIGGDILDGTLGGGGHAHAVLEESNGKGRLMGLDRDAHALALSRARLSLFLSRTVLVHSNFSRSKSALQEAGWEGVDGVLLDLGFSSLQIEDAGRGFSFNRSGPLDMRMNRDDPRTAMDILNGAAETELVDILRNFGEERAAKQIVRSIIRARAHTPISNTNELKRIVETSIGIDYRNRKRKRSNIHPATRTFQAFRIAVNKELEHLENFLLTGYELLRPGGRMVILSYHSLEDRLVKAAFRRWAADCVCPPGFQVCGCGWERKVRIVTAKPVKPSESEIARNFRARSARLRVVERLGGEI